MNQLAQGDALIALLDQNRASITAEIVTRVMNELPDYAHLSRPDLLSQAGRMLDMVLAILGEFDPAIARKYLEELTERRLREGMPMEPFVRSAEIVTGVLQGWITRLLAGDAKALTAGQRRIDNLLSLARSVTTRSYLAGLMPPPPGR